MESGHLMSNVNGQVPCRTHVLSRSARTPAVAFAQQSGNQIWTKTCPAGRSEYSAEAKCGVLRVRGGMALVPLL